MGRDTRNCKGRCYFLKLALIISVSPSTLRHLSWTCTWELWMQLLSPASSDSFPYKFSQSFLMLLNILPCLAGIRYSKDFSISFVNLMLSHCHSLFRGPFLREPAWTGGEDLNGPPASLLWSPWTFLSLILKGTKENTTKKGGGRLWQGKKKEILWCLSICSVAHREYILQSHSRWW